VYAYDADGLFEFRELEDTTTMLDLPDGQSTIVQTFVRGGLVVGRVMDGPQPVESPQPANDTSGGLDEQQWAPVSDPWGKKDSTGGEKTSFVWFAGAQLSMKGRHAAIQPNSDGDIPGDLGMASTNGVAGQAPSPSASSHGTGTAVSSSAVFTASSVPGPATSTITLNLSIPVYVRVVTYAPTFTERKGYANLHVQWAATGTRKEAQTLTTRFSHTQWGQQQDPAAASSAGPSRSNRFADTSVTAYQSDQALTVSLTWSEEEGGGALYDGQIMCDMSDASHCSWAAGTLPAVWMERR
jgi:hypothetical protein